MRGSTNAGRSGTSFLTFPAAAIFEAFSSHPPPYCCHHGCHIVRKSEGQPQTTACAAAALYPCAGKWQHHKKAACMPIRNTCSPSVSLPLWNKHTLQYNTVSHGVTNPASLPKAPAREYALQSKGQINHGVTGLCLRLQMFLLQAKNTFYLLVVPTLEDTF